VLRAGCEMATFMILFSSPQVLRNAARWADGVTDRFRRLAESSICGNALQNPENRA
jgi:hypothetical protein